MKGLELSKKFYFEYGEPMLKEQFGDVLPFLAVGFNRNPRNKQFESMATRHGNLKVKCVKDDGNEITLSVAPLDPYEVATIFFQ